jgi:N-acyl homoserine lactone hydrolase
VKVFACHSGGDRGDMATFDPFDPNVGTPMYNPYYFYVVEHPEGRVMFDSGLHPEVATNLEGRIGAADEAFPVEMEEGGDVVNQLKMLGLEPTDIDIVVQSHLHFDHCGGLEFLQHAPIYLQRQELDMARNPPVYQRDLYIPADFEHDLDWKLLDGDHDIFGDGKLKILATPGHTRGHQSLYIELENRNPLLLMADATYNLAKMRARRYQAVLWSPDAMVESWEKLERIEQETGAELRCTHEFDWKEKVPLAPDNYWS